MFYLGDLNYRKLFGKKRCKPTTSVDTALQGFHPSKLASIRTVKCDILCGLKEGVAESIDVENLYWTETGNWGVIQCSGNICCYILRYWHYKYIITYYILSWLYINIIIDILVCYIPKFVFYRAYSDKVTFISSHGVVRQ